MPYLQPNLSAQQMGKPFFSHLCFMYMYFTFLQAIIRKLGVLFWYEHQPMTIFTNTTMLSS